MKTLALLLSLISGDLLAGTIFLNIASENEKVPALSIPTANDEQCGELMMKLAKTPGTNFYLSCSSYPLPG